jgi:hypothetical protein
MMDFGGYRLQQKLKEDGFEDVFVSYDWDRNRVVIGRTYAGFDEPASNARERCREWLFSIRKAAYINPETGKSVLSGGLSGFARHFSHIGYAKEIDNVTQADALNALDRMFLVRSETYDWREERMAFACEGPLLGTTVSIEE